MRVERSASRRASLPLGCLFQLQGLAPGTQQAYVRYVQQLAEFVGKSPDQATDEGFRLLGGRGPVRPLDGDASRITSSWRP